MPLGHPFTPQQSSYSTDSLASWKECEVNISQGGIFALLTTSCDGSIAALGFTIVDKSMPESQTRGIL